MHQQLSAALRRPGPSRGEAGPEEGLQAGVPLGAGAPHTACWEQGWADALIWVTRVLESGLFPCSPLPTARPGTFKYHTVYTTNNEKESLLRVIERHFKTPRLKQHDFGMWVVEARG